MPRLAIEVRGLTVAYGSMIAVDNISHTFLGGTTTAIMGANGSGKTTFLNALAGLVTPRAGSIAGVDPTDIGYVMQHGTGPWMPITVGEVLEMGRYRHTGLLRRLDISDRAAISHAAERLGVAGLVQRQFHDLSGGQQQRVRVARVIAGGFSVLLLDEPITGLDLPSQERILEVVAAEAAQGKSIMITTHHLDEARHCDQVVLMAKQMVAAGTPDQVLQPETLRRAFGAKLLGDHDSHDHQHEMLILDDHGHGGHEHREDEHGDHEET